MAGARYVPDLLTNPNNICAGLEAELNGNVYTANNSVAKLQDVTENNPLTCRTDLTPCCKNLRRGEWCRPDGTKVPNKLTNHTLHRNRDDNRQVFLRRRLSRPLSQVPMGSYCCELSTVATPYPANETFCVILSESILQVCL